MAVSEGAAARPASVSASAAHKISILLVPHEQTRHQAPLGEDERRPVDRGWDLGMRWGFF